MTHIKGPIGFGMTPYDGFIKGPIGYGITPYSYVVIPVVPEALIREQSTPMQKNIKIIRNRAGGFRRNVYT